MKVVIWTLEQDKQNSIYIEKFMECDSIHVELLGRIKTMEQIQVEDEFQYLQIMSVYQKCETQRQLAEDNHEDCKTQRTNDQEIIDGLKKQNRWHWIGHAAITVVIIIALL